MRPRGPPVSHLAASPGGENTDARGPGSTASGVPGALERFSKGTQFPNGGTSKQVRTAERPKQPGIFRVEAVSPGVLVWDVLSGIFHGSHVSRLLPSCQGQLPHLSWRWFPEQTSSQRGAQRRGTRPGWGSLAALSIMSSARQSLSPGLSSPFQATLTKCFAGGRHLVICTKV